MKKYWHLCLFLCVVMLVQLVAAPVAAEEYDISVTQGCRGIDAGAPYLGTDQKVSNAEAVILYESGTDTLMYTWNADKPMYPASLVKIMTALVALEHSDIADIVTVKASSLSQIPSDAATAELQPDEVLTMEQLMYCLLVESANDAAAVIADHVAGSQSAFVAMMNQRAAEIGCTGTNFVNPHGLHNENQVTTARDMVKIISVAMENEAFRKFFGSSYYLMDATNKSESRKLTSSNHMMHKSTYEIYYDDRVIGGRTGVTNDGLNCLATVAQKGNMELICVVMGSRTTFVEGTSIIDWIGGFAETTKMLDLGFKGFTAAQILYDGQVLQQHTVAGGDAALTVGPKISLSTIVPSGSTLSSFNFRYSNPSVDLQAPIEKGQHIQDLEIWDGNVCVAYTHLYAMNAVEPLEMNVMDTNQEESDSLVGTILIVILILAAVVLIVLFVMRRINRKRHKVAAGRQRRAKRRMN